MEPNDYQIGGNHYDQKYKHWDFVCDMGLHYLLGCATKYPCRWRDKGGVTDLRKTAHYIAKAEDRDVRPLSMNERRKRHLEAFTRQFGTMESLIIKAICHGNYDQAQKLISEYILAQVEPEKGSHHHTFNVGDQLELDPGEASSRYINQDK